MSCDITVSSINLKRMWDVVEIHKVNPFKQLFFLSFVGSVVDLWLTQGKTHCLWLAVALCAGLTMFYTPLDWVGPLR